jgi:hypothetical protein
MIYYFSSTSKEGVNTTHYCNDCVYIDIYNNGYWYANVLEDIYKKAEDRRPEEPRPGGKAKQQ